MDDRADLPVSEDTVFRIARSALADPLRPTRPDPVFRIGQCHAKRASDTTIDAFVVTVLVNPRLVASSSGRPGGVDWVAEAAIIIHFDANGELLEAPTLD